MGPLVMRSNFPFSLVGESTAAGRAMITTVLPVLPELVVSLEGLLAALPGTDLHDTARQVLLAVVGPVLHGTLGHGLTLRTEHSNHLLLEVNLYKATH